MQKMTDVYRVSIKDHRKEALKRLEENERGYASLTDKRTGYAKAIKALQDLHRQVWAIYRDAPNDFEELDLTEEPQ